MSVVVRDGGYCLIMKCVTCFGMGQQYVYQNEVVFVMETEMPPRIMAREYLGSLLFVKCCDYCWNWDFKKQTLSQMTRSEAHHQTMLHGGCKYESISSAHEKFDRRKII